MGLFSRKSAPATPPASRNDQYRLKRTGKRVTLLEHLDRGEVRIAMDTADVCQEDIVNARDITPA